MDELATSKYELKDLRLFLKRLQVEGTIRGETERVLSREWRWERR